MSNSAQHAMKIGEPMTDERRYELNGPADPQFSRVARLAISGIISEADANVEDIDDVRLVISELINIALDSKAVNINLVIINQGRSLSFSVNAEGVDEKVTNDLSMRIFNALVKDFKISVNKDNLSMSGTMIFAE